MCPACFKRQATSAALASGVLVLFLGTVGFCGRQDRSASSPESAGHGLGPVEAASYVQAGITTDVRELKACWIPENREEFKFGWGKSLFAPLDQEKLVASGSGFTGDLLSRGSTGRVDEETSTSRKITVIGGSHQFEITQTKNP